MFKATTEQYLESLANTVTEIRLFKSDKWNTVISGYYSAAHYEKLMKDIEQHEKNPKTTAIYHTLHNVDESLVARANNRLVEKPKATTTDNEIKSFSVFPADIDPERASGISSTDAELELAKAGIQMYHDFLISIGIPETALAKGMSGNGYHELVYLYQLKTTDENIKAFKALGDLVAAHFSEKIEGCSFDAVNYNPSRIWKLYGTTSRKGDNTKDRPHRQSQVWIPTDAERTRIDFADLESKIRAELQLKGSTVSEPTEPTEPTDPVQMKAAKTKAAKLPKDCSLSDFLDYHGISYSKAKPDKKGGTKYRVQCPHDPSHTGGWVSDAGHEGKWMFACSHNSCSGERSTWAAFKQALGLDVSPKGGRPSNAEKALTAQSVPTEKPIVMLNRIDNTGEKPFFTDRPRVAVAEEIAEILFDTERTDNFFRRGQELGALRRDGDTLRFKPYDAEGICGVISRAVSLQRYYKDSIVEVANPHRWIAADILQNQNTDALPSIEIILTHPYWAGGTGGLQTTQGFDPVKSAYLDLKVGNNDLNLSLSDHSAAEDVSLWREWLSDFPFKDESDFENALAYALTLIIRPGLPIGEVSPMFLITAPREGVGKTLLCDVLTTAVTGIPTETRTLGHTPNDIKNELCAALRGAPEVLIFDNIDPKKRLDSDVLASVVTQVRGRFRPLHTSTEMTYENRATTAYTGSNIELTPELCKRMVAIRLYDPGIAEKDRQVKVKNILSETLQRHPEFVSSLLRMVQRWLNAEKEEIDPLHRMREWSVLIAGILRANGIGDHFLANADAVLLQAGEEFTAWANAFKAIAEQLGDKAFEAWTVRDVFEILSYTDKVYSPEGGTRGLTSPAKGDNILGEHVHGATDNARAKSLGRILRSKVGTVYAGLELVDTHQSESRGKSRLYRLENRGYEPPPEPIQEETAPEEATPQTILSPEGVMEEVLKAVEGLPANSNGRTLQEVAQLLDVSTEDVRLALCEALDKKHLETRTGVNEELFWARLSSDYSGR